MSEASFAREAFLSYSGQIYRVSLPALRSLDVHTPLTALIEEVWSRYPDKAFHLLRSRIYTNYEPTLRCKGAVKVAAKRMTPVDPAEFNALSKAPGSIDLTPHLDSRVEDQNSLVTPPPVQGLTEAIRWLRDYPFATANRPIAALLLDSHLKPVLASINTSSQNRLHHAEVNLLKQYVRAHRQPVPRGFQIVVSLKPCCMCGGFIADLCQDGVETPVTYLEDDPGPKARTSPLTRLTQAAYS